MMTGKARVAAVIGWPVSHSRSPRLHGTWLERHGIDGAYVPLAVRPEDAEAALRALPRLGFAGANVTVPHKETAFAVADILTERARRMGAVNTLVVQPDGRLLGDNTDGFGFLENLRQGCPAFDLPARPAVVLGAGGAARGVVAALLEAGCPEVRLLNRTEARAQALAQDLGGLVRVFPWTALPQALEGAGLLANATSLGMQGQPPLAVDLAGLDRSVLVTDLVYVPLETDLLARARANGNPVVDGLGMLLHQARPGFEAWFGVAPTVDEALRRAVLGEA
ncbi:shikimate dehydrogenase [Pararhodospirillum photometricum]|uniref:Shikimate dehydrogenase (NADP(+)) n=1 Tax=Pararhodospirillum photometricum DSM 122 TaxID=1150469 RepID=H6SRM1_PARPM|nr:shikimate dehydrogenase [Pararhodospirillum photometricum]CCG07550.1 Shikimate dehydrogenase [Pararhodospirillum photometricum DSM 122]